jgi:hypothetical protein
MPKPVELTITIPTRKASHTLLSDMLARYSYGGEGAPGDILNPVDTLVLTEFLKRHPDAAKKIGPGIAYFQKVKPYYDEKSGGFLFARIDGTAMTFSIKAIVEGPDHKMTSKAGWWESGKRAVPPLGMHPDLQFIDEYPARPEISVSPDTDTQLAELLK